MSKQEDGTSIKTKKDNTEQIVIEYLKNNHTFFCDHPNLIEEIEIPHNCGEEVVSLIEHQVQALKEKNRAYRQKLKELLEIARENDQLNDKLNKMTLDLISTNNLDDVLLAVQDNLRNEFEADIVSIKLFAKEGEEDKHPELMTGNDPEIKAFESLFVSQRPLCGHLKKEQLTFLFKDNGKRIGSAAVVPLENSRRYGILAIGSFNVNKFLPNMGTIFLRHMSNAISQALTPHMN